MTPDYEQTVAKGKGVMLSTVSALFASSKFADLVVRCGDRTWNVHRAVLCARSEYTAKACEGKSKEAKAGKVVLHNDDADVIHKMLDYMYNNEYNDGNTSTDPMVLNVRLIAAAEEYFVDHLASIAVCKFAYYANDKWCTPRFADAIAEAYTTVADRKYELRDTLLDVVQQHASELFDQERQEHTYFRDMVKRVPAFGAEIAGILATSNCKKSDGA